MKLKSLIKTFIPPACFYMREILKGIKGKLLLSKKNNIHIPYHNHESILILGNGPSLKTTLMNLPQGMDYLVVNLFATTSYYAQICPSWYLLVDPAFFLDKKKMSQRLLEIVNSVKDNLITKTKWKMNLCVPIVAYNSEFLKEINDNNRFINIVYFNNIGDESIFPDTEFKFYLWNKSFIGAKQQTVLNTAIHISIVQAYNKIYVAGADSSWHENLILDQDTNILYTKDTHFYGNKTKIPVYKDEAGKIRSKVHEELYYNSKALSNYWTLEKYAQYNKCKIFNVSSYSWIDAFERIKL